jgi:UDP-N-acetylmuramate--alanine ligase
MIDAPLVDARHVHMVGVGGAGMSGLAKILAQAGHEVSGSDLKPAAALTALRAAGVETWVGHQPDRAPGWDLVVASSAVPPTDPEIVGAETAGVEVWQRPRLLEEMTARMPAIGVAGTHGKTTSTAMAVTALRGIGRDPSFMVGGEMVGLNTNAHLGERDLFVLESDEAFGTFTRLGHRALLITNVEADHLDHYGTAGALADAFSAVAAGVEGPVVVCADDPGAVAAGGPAAVTYGVSPSAQWRITDLHRERTSISFTLAHDGTSVGVTVPKPGLHIASNAAGVVAMLAALGVDPAAAGAALAGFAGVRRRFEVRAVRGGVTVIDDYAHHQTELQATIAAAAGEGRVIAAFQPHRFTRTGEHHEALGTALAAADLVMVTDVYAAGEPPIPGVTGRLVADAAGRAGADAEFVPRRTDLAARLAAVARPGDVVLLLGAGDITLTADELAPLLGGPA